jgi:elongation factor 1-beta
MGKVAVTVKIMPEGVDVDLEKVKEEVRKRIEVKDLKEVPIAFGLKAVEVLVLTDDEKGSEWIVERLSNIEGVSRVEIEKVTLV